MAVFASRGWTGFVVKNSCVYGAAINLEGASIRMGASPGTSRREGVARLEGRSWRRREPT
ncbi:hypothetical protein [Mesorhizobium huakuii]|nr:hypothetical protein [Mesorhizobium huakuii]